MKKLFITLLLVSTCFAAYAQNTFPASGAVGIGTTSPTQPFEVVSATGGSFSPTAKSTAVFFQDLTNGRGVDLGYDASGQIGIIGANAQSASNPSSLAFWTVNSSGWAENMRLTSSGYLGIGVVAPLNPLQVNGNIAALAASSSTNTYFEFQRASDGYTGARVGNFYEQNGYKGSLVFETNNGGGATTLSEAMRITSGGNVLIGQTTQSNASYILDVKGSVRANTITVNVTGADFVFAPSYKLLTLPELNNFIQKNQHLPEIASAKDMQTNGLDVGDNQIKLLQKVEELTLYLIEKDKQVKSQQQQLDNQQQVNTQQENRLDTLEKEIEVMKQQMDKMAKQSSK